MKKMIGISLVVLTAFTVFAGARAFAANEVDTASVASTLNNLVDQAVDGQKGFQEAAEKVTSEDLKSRFMAISEERAKFAADLRDKVTGMGEKADNGGSLEGSARIAWIDIKSAFASNDDKAVLGAVKNGESRVLQVYRKACEKDLPKDVRDLVQKQTDKIQSSYDWMSARLNEEEQSNP